MPFVSHPIFLSAKHVLCYVNYKSEVETIPIIEKCFSMKKHVYCPCVTGREMDFYEIFSLSDLKEGYRGILEPEKQEKRIFQLPQNESVLMIMPGAVFDRERHRIGYGGGYYDKYLAKIGSEYEKNGVKLPLFSTVALAFSMQISDKVEQQEHDICPQMIVTEKEIII